MTSNAIRTMCPATAIKHLEEQASTLARRLTAMDTAWLATPMWRLLRRTRLKREAEEARRNLSLAKAAIRHWQARKPEPSNV